MRYGWEIADDVQRFVGNAADMQYVPAESAGKAWAEVRMLRQAIEFALQYDPDTDRYKIKHTAWPKLKAALSGQADGVAGDTTDGGLK